jgi:hypothetical protein
VATGNSRVMDVDMTMESVSGSQLLAMVTTTSMTAA